MNQVTISETAWRNNSDETSIGTLVERMRQSGEPLLIRRDGEQEAVLVDAVAYELLLHRLALIQEVQKAKEDILAGRVVKHEEAKKKLLSKISQ